MMVPGQGEAMHGNGTNVVDGYSDAGSALVT